MNSHPFASSTHRAAAGAAVAALLAGPGVLPTALADATQAARRIPRAPYTARIVEPAGWTTGSVATGLNDAQMVTGNALNEAGGEVRGFVARRGSAAWLGGSESTRAHDVSPNGVVVGSTTQGSDQPWLHLPARWSPSGEVTPLPIAWPQDFSFYKNGSARAVNRRLETVGSLALGTRTGAALRWDRKPAAAAPIQSTGGGWNLAPTDIADTGLVVGYDQAAYSAPPTGEAQRAVVIEKGRVETFPRLGEARSSAVTAISPNGRLLVGTVDNRPAQFFRGRTPVLEAAAGDLLPEGVSDAGTVVGAMPTPAGGTTAAVYARGRLSPLLPLTGGLPAGWSLRGAHAINKHGDIAATAVDPGGRPHAVLLDAR